MRNGSSTRSLLSDILLGAAAGAAATWVMGKATSFLYERESKRVRDEENEARGGKTAYVIAVEKTADAAGVRLTDDAKKQFASAIHWAIGIGAGAVYGGARNLLPHVGIGSGVGYGLLFWLVMDEGAITLLGLTPPPQEFPWQTHARGVAGHVVFGAITEAVFDAVDVAA